jgi:hypothetical protein
MDNDKITVVITARGEGTRMKGLSPKPKHLLYFGGERIVDRIKACFEGCAVEVLEGPPTANRAATLELLRGKKNVLIVDCDVIPESKFPEERPLFQLKNTTTDAIWFFYSINPKYGGLYPDENIRLNSVTEKGDTVTKCRASGLYFLKDVGQTIDRMTDPNSIASGMIGARMIPENTFIRVGDPEDYLNALK